MTETYVTELSTAVAQTKKFTIDGKEYDLLTLDSLSERQETELTAMFARNDVLAQKLSRAKSDKVAEQLAGALVQKRDELLIKLTNIPEPEVKKLPISLKGKLYRTIEKELREEAKASGADVEDEDDGSEDEADADADEATSD